MEILSKIKNWYNKNKKELTKVVTVGVIVSDILSYLFLVIASLSAYLKTFTFTSFSIFILFCLLIPLFFNNFISRIKSHRNNEIKINKDYFQTIPTLSIFMLSLLGYINGLSNIVILLEQSTVFLILPVCYHYLNYKIKTKNEILTKYSKNIKKIESSEILFSLISNKDSIKIEQNKFLNKDDK